MTKHFGKTWWGEQWLYSLNNIDFSNRLPRGSSYARGEAVQKITINGNKIDLLVSGSRPKPYAVSIILPVFSGAKLFTFLDTLSSHPGVISKLLNRELDPLQFAEMGRLLEHFITERDGDMPLFYHGGCSLKQRKAMTEGFQQNPADKIFILSLKAAGTGLNLTAASHVNHYDLWWNPAVEAQATDRAYRIGQNKNVMVHCFITKNTFEERINEMIQSKKAVASLTVSTGENWIGNLSNKELKEIFELK